MDKSRLRRYQLTHIRAGDFVSYKFFIRIAARFQWLITIVLGPLAAAIQTKYIHTPSDGHCIHNINRYVWMHCISTVNIANAHNFAYHHFTSFTHNDFLCSLLKWNTTCLLLQNIGFYFCIVFAWFFCFWFSISLMWNSRHILWPMSVFCCFWWEIKKMNCFWSTFRYGKIKTSAVIFCLRVNTFAIWDDYRFQIAKLWVLKFTMNYF